MKYVYLFILLLTLSCGGIKKKPETTNTIEIPLSKEQELLVVLKNVNNLEDVQALIINSGLTWDKIAFENNSTKIGVIKVPNDKTQFWLDRLKKSGEFTSVDTYKKETLTALIKKAKMAFFTFRKTACFGDCPVYDVTIDAKGNVFYKGIQYVNVTGEKRFTLTEKEFTLLKEKLTNNDISKYKRKYDNPDLTDLPSTFISYKDQQVQIRLWKQIPKNLIDVHEYVQGILLDKKLFN